MGNQSNKNKKGRGSGWTYQETKAFLDFWIEFLGKSDGNGEISNNSKGSNSIYNDVSVMLCSRRIFKSPDQCRERIKTLKRSYRHVLDNSVLGFKEMVNQATDDRYRFAEEMRIILNKKTDTTPLKKSVLMIEVSKYLNEIFFEFICSVLKM